MTPEQFWESTPREIADMARGAKWRERRTWERLAWLAATVIAPHMGHQTPTIDRLLSFLGPEEGVKQPEPVTEEDARRIVEGIAREHKKKFWTLISDEFAEGGDKKE